MEGQDAERIGINFAAGFAWTNLKITLGCLWDFEASFFYFAVDTYPESLVGGWIHYILKVSLLQLESKVVALCNHMIYFKIHLKVSYSCIFREKIFYLDQKNI